MAVAIAYPVKINDVPEFPPPSKKMDPLPKIEERLPQATTIKWGDKIYILHDQSVSYLHNGQAAQLLMRKTRMAAPTTMELSLNGFVLGLPNGKVEVWDIHGSRTSLHAFEAEASQVNSIDTLGHSILCGTNQLSLVDTRQADAPWTIWDHHRSPVQSVSFVSETIFTSGSEDTLKLWDSRTRRPLVTIERNITALDWFGPRMISAGSDNVVRLWELTSTSFAERETYELPCSTVYLTRTCAVALSTNHVYMRSGEEVKLQKLQNPYPPSALSPNRDYLVTQDASGYITFFKLA